MKKPFNIFGKIVLFGVLAVIVIISITLFSFWIEHNNKMILPAPTGNFSIGRTTFDWTDSTRIDSLAQTPNVKRQLFIWVWYPASKTRYGLINNYLPTDWRKAVAQKQGFLLSNFITTDLTKVYTHSIANSKLSPEQAQYPIVIMKSGIGALAIDYTTIAEDLASHGYIVVGSDSPYSTFVVVFSDGRVITRNWQGNPGDADPSEERTHLLNHLVTIWSEDTHFILNKLEQLNINDSSNQFYHRLNLNKVGIFGHSFGGATALQFCRDDQRCKAGVDIDGQPFGSLIQTCVNIPFMFLLADHSQESDSLSNRIKSNIDTIYNRLPTSRVWIYLRGARHFNFTDDALLKERFVSRLFGALGSIGERRGLQVEASCLRTFFNVYLKGVTTTKIKDLSRKYPEVIFEK